MFAKLKHLCPGVYAWSFVFIILLLALSGCGQKGDLYLPAPQTEATEQDQNESS